jgi:NADPH:quinone reductase-like Zn-dependent oxidoreductase
VVVVTGASGGVGSAVVQLAAARGATIWAVTSERKADQVRSLGAERIALRGDDLSHSFGRNGVDVVIDLVAGPSFPSLLSILRAHGTYAVSGAIGGPFVELDVRTLYLKDLRLLGCTVLDTEVFPNLVARIEAGEISPLVFETFPLAKIVEAQEAFLRKRHVGKIVLTIAAGKR